MKKHFILKIVVISILALETVFVFIPVIGVTNSHNDGGRVVSETKWFSLFQIMIFNLKHGFPSSLFFISGLSFICCCLASIIFVLFEKKIVANILIGLANVFIIPFVIIFYPMIFSIICCLILISTLVVKMVVENKIK